MMLKKLSLLRLLFVFYSCCDNSVDQISVPKNEYGLEVINDMEHYKYFCDKDSNFILVDLEDEIPGISMDIRYATSDNFTGEVIYEYPKAFARKPLAQALKRVQAELAEEGLGLKIFDAYRPYAATLLFWDIIKDTNFAASPATGSRHNRGCALDVTLIDLETGKEIDMPTEFDDFSEKANPFYEIIPEPAKTNRDKLIDIMQRYGFTVYPTEWWHFDYSGWEQYYLMDISFGELINQ